MTALDLGLEGCADTYCTLSSLYCFLIFCCRSSRHPHPISGHGDDDSLLPCLGPDGATLPALVLDSDFDSLFVNFTTATATTETETETDVNGLSTEQGGKEREKEEKRTFFGDQTQEALSRIALANISTGAGVGGRVGLGVREALLGINSGGAVTAFRSIRRTMASYAAARVCTYKVMIYD